MFDRLGKACALCNELKVGLACLSEQCARPVHVDCRWSKTPYGCNIEHVRCCDSSKDHSFFLQAMRTVFVGCMMLEAARL